jgi:catalase-peroxidase
MTGCPPAAWITRCAPSNDFFVNLLDMATEWKASSDANSFEGRDRKTGELMLSVTRVYMVLG